MPAKDPPSPSGKAAGGGWRGTPKAQPQAGRPSGQKAGGWTKKKDRGYERAARRHRTKIALWSLLFVALVIGFIVWLIPRPVRTPFLVVTVPTYESPMPPNAWAREDAERLRILDDEEIVTYLAISSESGELASSLRRELAESEPDKLPVKPGGPGKDVVIIYLSMHGVVDGDNDPCLLSPGASALQSGQWLKVSRLLDDLFLGDGPGKLPDKVKKLLILDCNRMDANWNMGLLYNGFAERLKSVVEKAKIPNLFVLNSAGPGQIGWAAPELENSVFAYFLWQGLEGAADAEQTGDGDAVVSLRELHDYLKAHVGQWVRENRADVQEPMLLPQGADFPLVHAKSRDKTSIPETKTDSGPLWRDIHSLWEDHAELSEKTPYRHNPLGWEEFQHKLLRLEQLAQAGKAYQDQFSDTKNEADALATALAEEEAGQNLAAYSFPLARRLRKWPDAKELETVRARLVKALQQDTRAERPEPEAGAEKAADKPKPEAGAEKGADKPEAETPPDNPPQKPEPETDQPYGYLAASTAVWDRFVDGPVREELPRMLEFVDGADRLLRTDVVELHFLRMLNSYLDTVVWEAGLDQVKRALAARDLAEKAAAPTDERAHYWIKEIVDPADDQRRRAEDGLFLGAFVDTEDALAEADRSWAQLTGNDGAYQAAAARAKEVAAAFQARDRAWAEIPYLAQWLLARLHPSDAAHLDTLGDLIEGTHQLGAELDASLESAEWTPELRQMQQAVAGKLDILEKAFDQECSDLGPAGGDQRKLRAIATVLASPLVTGKQRNDLRKNYLTIARETGSAGTGYQVALAEGTAGEADAAAQADPGRRYLDRLKRWEKHPALAILSRAEGPAAKGEERRASGERSNDGSRAVEDAQLAQRLQLEGLSDQGEEVRRLLKTAAEEAEKRLAETAEMLKLQQQPNQSSPAIRAGCSRADRLVRGCAALLGRQPWSQPGADPVHLLRDLDLHYLLLWQGQRTLDDFWGPRPTPGRETPFFEIAGRHYLDSAQELCRHDAGLRAGKDPVSRLFTLRCEAARAGIQPEKPQQLFVDEQEPFIKHGFSVTLADNLPGGTAALYLQDSRGLLFPVLPAPQAKQPELRRMGVPVRAASTESSPDYWIRNDSRLEGTSVLQAVALYRGHLKPCTFYVQPATGLDIVYNPPEPRKPRLTVYGDLRRRGSVVFILDCSGSMGNILPKEKMTRIAAARGSLEAILDTLAKPNMPYHVGLLIYGHSVGWHPDRSGRIIIRDYKDPKGWVVRPPDSRLHPADDVQPALELGAFGKDQFDEVREKLRLLKPLGETPLYLAIIQAIEDLRKADQGSQRRIVAITDGLNQQSGGGSKGVKARSHVEAALKRHPDICLDIVGFGIGDQDFSVQVRHISDPRERAARIARLQKDLEEGLRELRELAEQTGGSFHRAGDPSGLLETLEKSFAPGEYVVQSAATGKTVAGPLELGTPCEIDQATDRKQKYIVKLLDPQEPAQTQVEVKEGESLEIYLQEDPLGQQRRLVHRRYETELRGFFDKVPDPLGEGGRSFFVAAHLPLRRGSAVRFFTSVQNSDPQQFSPWPEEAWVRVEPDLPPAHPDAGTVYSFYDAMYEPDCPVPVLSSLALNWPADAKKAKVQLWCKLARTRPDQTLTVAGLRQEKPRIDGVPNVTFELETKRGAAAGDPYRVMITERHPTAADLHSVKVEMVPTPEMVKHRYNSKRGTIRHTFFYDDSASREIEGYEVWFTSRAKLVDQAITLPKPLEVTLPRD